MIKTMRSLTIKSGKDVEAMEYAVRVAKFMSDNAPGQEMEVWQNLDGSIRRIHFVATYDSIAAFDEVMSFMGQNEAFIAFQKENLDQELFDVNSDTRHFFKTLG